MSTVMRPRGPLPARVYWTRRLLLVGLVMVALVLVWWGFPGGGGSGAASADPGSQTPTVPTTPATTQHTPQQHPSGGPGSGTSHQPGGTHATTTAPPTTPTRTTASTPVQSPSGPCDPTKVRLTVVVDNAAEGAGAPVRLRMSTTDGSTCELGITPSRLEMKITSGIATVWQSASCPDGLPAKNVVVGPHPAVGYAIRWDGHVTADSCSSGGPVARPGTYWAQAALLGGEPHKTSFAVVPSAPGKHGN